MTDFKTLLQAFDQLLQPEKFKDYGPNGLQVEGRVRVRKLVSGVTASLAFIDAAIDAGALRTLDRMIDQTIEYTRQRQAFGRSILDNQSVHFRLAELRTEVELLRE